MGEVVFFIPFIAIIVVLLIIVAAFEVRKRKIRRLMRKGYTFVVNPYGRIITMIPPGENYSELHQRQSPQSFPPQYQPMGFSQPSSQPTSFSDQQLPYPPQQMPFPQPPASFPDQQARQQMPFPQQPSSFSDQQPPYLLQPMPFPQQPTAFSDQQPPYPQQSMPLPHNQKQSPRY